MEGLEWKGRQVPELNQAIVAGCNDAGMTFPHVSERALRQPKGVLYWQETRTHIVRANLITVTQPRF
jgi:hypothetical protein